MAHAFSNKHGLSRLKFLVMLTNENKVIELSEEKLLDFALSDQTKKLDDYNHKIFNKMSTMEND